jgi:hypothetical protein
VTPDDVAGFFDGEGTVWVRTYPSGCRAAKLTFYNTHRETLEAIHAYLGVGVVKQRRGMAARALLAHRGPKPQWQLDIHGNNQARRVLQMLQPLAITKREAIDAALRATEPDLERVCVVCGRHFESINKNAIYCRNACNQAAYARRRRAKELRCRHDGPWTGSANQCVIDLAATRRKGGLVLRSPDGAGEGRRQPGPRRPWRSARGR